MQVLRVILTSLGSLAILFLLCKANGQRQLSQMTMFDYINSISIGSIAAELATELENWIYPLIAMIIFGIVTLLVNKLTCKSILARRFCIGRPLILLENGKISEKNLARSSIDLNEFLSQCRVAGYFNLNQLHAVVLEPNGQFSFLPCPGSRPASPDDLHLAPPPEPLWYSLILDGKLLEKNLHSSGKNEVWLKEQLAAQRIHSIHDTLFAGCDSHGSFFACAKKMPPVEKDIFE